MELATQGLPWASVDQQTAAMAVKGSGVSDADAESLTLGDFLTAFLAESNPGASDAPSVGSDGATMAAATAPSEAIDDVHVAQTSIDVAAPNLMAHIAESGPLSSSTIFRKETGRGVTEGGDSTAPFPVSTELKTLVIAQTKEQPASPQRDRIQSAAPLELTTRQSLVPDDDVARAKDLPGVSEATEMPPTDTSRASMPAPDELPVADGQHLRQMTGATRVEGPAVALSAVSVATVSDPRTAQKRVDATVEENSSQIDQPNERLRLQHMVPAPDAPTEPRVASGPALPKMSVPPVANTIANSAEISEVPATGRAPGAGIPQTDDMPMSPEHPVARSASVGSTIHTPDPMSGTTATLALPSHVATVSEASERNRQPSVSATKQAKMISQDGSANPSAGLTIGTATGIAEKESPAMRTVDAMSTTATDPIRVAEFSVLDARATQGPVRGDGMPQSAAPDLPRTVSQPIVDALRLAPGQVDVTVSPEELGRLTLSMSTSESAMQVHIAAERQDTLDLLRRHIATLQIEAHAAGFGDISFSFGGGGTEERPHGDPGTSVMPGDDVSVPDPETVSLRAVPLSRNIDLRL